MMTACSADTPLPTNTPIVKSVLENQEIILVVWIKFTLYKLSSIFVFDEHFGGLERIYF